jgi:hypothetical protein
MITQGKLDVLVRSERRATLRQRSETFDTTGRIHTANGDR